MFRKILAANSITKAAQIFYNYLGYFEKHHFKVETAVATEYAIQAFCHVF